MTYANSPLPHHRLRAYEVALQLLAAVRAAQIADAKLRDEALRAAKGACLNISEAAARISAADKARVFGIARAECCEAAAAVEIAVHAGDARAKSLEAVLAHGRELYAILTALSRHR